MAKEFPDRKVLEKVPRIGFNVHTCPFPGALHAFLAFIGDVHDYDYLMGVTGAPFRRIWNPDDGGNVDLLLLGGEPLRRVFDALGYEWHLVTAVKSEMVEAIVESIAANRPAFSFGILGPPEAGLVTGYSQRGETLFGWSYFQDRPPFALPPDRYYESARWFESMEPQGESGLLVVGAKSTKRRDPRFVLQCSIQWALDLELTPHRVGLPDHVCGLAAYQAWADALEIDRDFGDEATIDARLMVHGDQCTMLYERMNAAGYLRKMSGAAPEISHELDAAADRYDRVADFAADVWPFPLDFGPECTAGLADGVTRRTIAKAVREAAAIEHKAVTHLEHALNAFRS